MSAEKFVRHPINYRCPTCAAIPGERCVGLGPHSGIMVRKYHRTREFMARQATSTREIERVRKHG